MPDMVYIRSIPKAIPPGKVLVHNHVYPDGKRALGLGEYGSRAWFQKGKARLEVCKCGFAPGVTHYRVKRAIIRRAQESMRRTLKKKGGAK